MDYVFHYLYKNFVWSNEDGSITVRLFAFKDSLKSAKAIYGPKLGWGVKETHEVEMEKVLSNSTFDMYEATLRMKDRRFLYYFEVTSSKDDKTYFFTSQGLIEPSSSIAPIFYGFQFCHVFDGEKTIIPTLARKGGAVMQIFPDRFAIGDYKKKAMKDVNLKIGQTPDYKSFFGGDLKGIMDKLDYIQSLGISTIYLTPIFKSTTYHRYDVEDYTKIDERLGGDKAFKKLVDEIHMRGMSIICDAVFNHTSFRSPLFQDVLKNGKKSQYYDFYFCDGDPSFEKGNYLMFATTKEMPKLNTENPKVIDYCVKAITKVTKKFNIDGWRFDVADEVSHFFWENIHYALRKINPGMILIGEDWMPSENYLEGNQFDGVMNYQLREILLDVFANHRADASNAVERMNSLLMRYSWNQDLSMLNLISSHDTPRFKTLVNGDERKVLAATILAVAYPGLFMSYYGDELGMEGGKDPLNRLPIDWSKTHDNKEFTKLYKQILTLKNHPEFLTGKVHIQAEGSLIKISRYFSNEKTIQVWVNTVPAKVHGDLDGQLIFSVGYNNSSKSFGPFAYAVSCHQD